MKSSNNNTLLLIAIIAVIVSAIAFFMVWNSNLDYQVFLQPNGTTQVEIIQNLEIDFLASTIDFQAGFVTPGSGNALLDTVGAGTSLNWEDSGGAIAASLFNDGFVIENIGNINADLRLYLDQSVENWLDPGAGPLSSPGDFNLSINVTNCFDGSTYICDPALGNVQDDTSTACTVGAGLFNGLGVYQIVNETSQEPTLLSFCNPFTFANTADEIQIDLRLAFAEALDPTGGQVSALLVADITAV